MSDGCMNSGQSKEPENKLKKEYKLGIQEIMHSQTNTKEIIVISRLMSVFVDLTKTNLTLL